jgi:protease-4
MTGPERSRLVAILERYYQLFLRRVAGGRRRPVRAIEPVAGGRVWSGRAARDLGLVDRLGTYDDALRRLYEHTGLRPGRWALPRWDLRDRSLSTGQRLLQVLLADAMVTGPLFGPLAALASVLRLPASLELFAEQLRAGRVEPLALLDWEPGQPG